MTICIAALCDDATKVVMCSDRMITTEKYAIKFEHEIPKIEEINGNCAAVSAGDSLSSQEVLENGKEFLEESESPSVEEIVGAVKIAYAMARTREISERVLGLWPAIGECEPDEEDLGPPDGVFEEMTKEVLEYDLIVELLIGGVDESGGHIHLVANPGSSACFDPLGFHAIGMGEPHAVATLVSSGYNSTFSLKQSIFLVFLAKKVAEKAPGVGKQTDLCYIDKKGIHFLDDKQMEYLENLVQEKEEAERSSIEKIRKAIDKIRL